MKSGGDLERDFLNLVAKVKSCTKCERMCDSARVLSLASGNLNAKVMFIGEAPGRRGADKTEIPFHGDVAGNNFEEFLSFSGMHRSDIFVTNAVLCNPKDEKGNNATPNPSEVLNCSVHLKKQIEIINPKIIVTLGASALNAAGLLEPHGLTLKASVRTAVDWYGRKLIPLYHPGQRAIIHRSKANQRSDYQFVAETLRRVGVSYRKVYGATPENVIDICKYMLSRRGEMSYFEIHKYFYLLEYTHVKENGVRLTNAHFIRQKDGPYCTDLHIDKIRKSDPSIISVNKSGRLYLRYPAVDLFADKIIDRTFVDYVNKIFERYSYENESDLKKAVYFTAPMKMILRKEKNLKKNFYNSPIEFIAA